MSLRELKIEKRRRLKMSNFDELSNMNKREFIKSAAVIAGAAAVKPLTAAAPVSATTSVTDEKNNAEALQGVTLKKSLGFGMINEELYLTDKFKLIKDLGFDGVELNSTVDFDTSPLPETINF